MRVYREGGHFIPKILSFFFFFYAVLFFLSFIGCDQAGLAFKLLVDIVCSGVSLVCK